MDQMQKSHYQKACIVICGDVMEDWKYIFRELRMRVSVSDFSNLAIFTSERSMKPECLWVFFKGRYT